MYIKTLECTPAVPNTRAHTHRCARSTHTHTKSCPHLSFKRVCINVGNHPAGLKIEWSNCGQYLAVGGFLRLPNLQCRNELHFYSCEGKRIHWVPVPSQVRSRLQQKSLLVCVHVCARMPLSSTP